MLKWKNIWSKPAKWAPTSEKNFGGISTVLGGFLESDLSLEADRHLRRLKPAKKDLNSSLIDQKGRPLNKMIGIAVLQRDVK